MADWPSSAAADVPFFAALVAAVLLAPLAASFGCEPCGALFAASAGSSSAINAQAISSICLAGFTPAEARKCSSSLKPIGSVCCLNCANHGYCRACEKSEYASSEIFLGKEATTDGESESPHCAGPTTAESHPAATRK